MHARRSKPNSFQVCTHVFFFHACNRYRDSDERYLKLASSSHSLFDSLDIPKPWITLPLSISHRLPQAISTFVNQIFFHGIETIKSNKQHGPNEPFPVQYYHCEKPAVTACQVLTDWLDNGVLPGEILIITPTPQSFVVKGMG